MFTRLAVNRKRLQILALAALVVIGGFSFLISPTVSAGLQDTSDGCPLGYQAPIGPLQEPGFCYRPGVPPGSPTLNFVCYPPEVQDGTKCKLPVGTPSAIPGGGATPPPAGAPAPTGNPKCAVVNFGPIPCPTVGSGIDPNSNSCYVRDPNAANVADRSRFLPADCGNAAFTPPAAINCDNAATPSELCDPAFACTGNQCNLTIKYINPIIKALAALVGVGVTISIVIAGIQYSSSASDPQKVAAAKRRIITAILTLLGFFLFYRFLDWILPGSL